MITAGGLLAKLCKTKVSNETKALIFKRKKKDKTSKN